MKHAIACKLDGQHGVLIHAPRLRALVITITPTIYRNGQALRLTGSMPSLAVIAVRINGENNTIALFSRS